ncbi:hypothetical protein P12x_005337 [Tundrisphaera lichenicola]|uniref:hypothetical protein n=1 Tax=Tundrisphaera lichenicola TaxID=2029860 RepID=UPI003EBB4BF4
MFECIFNAAAWYVAILNGSMAFTLLFNPSEFIEAFGGRMDITRDQMAYIKVHLDAAKEAYERREHAC